jgi:hypothetical protein
MKIRIESDHDTLFISSSLKNNSVIGSGTANFTDRTASIPASRKNLAADRGNP